MYFEYYLFLQYLWGIETSECRTSPHFPLQRFYSTYEELKQKLMFTISKTSFGFYSTYEELKQYSLISCPSPLNLVFTVPMRNWNKSESFRQRGTSFVFTVPMRNWNFKKSVDRVAETWYVFTVPMRNWNYSKCILWSNERIRFYSNYEEMKLSRKCKFRV